MKNFIAKDIELLDQLGYTQNIEVFYNENGKDKTKKEFNSALSLAWKSGNINSTETILKYIS